MPLKVVRRKASQVPPPPRASKLHDDLERLKSEIGTLTADTVIEVEAVSAQAIRGVKALITRASRQVGIEVKHWHVGTKVFAQPKAEAAPRRPAQAKPVTTTRRRAAAPTAPPARKGRPRKAT